MDNGIFYKISKKIQSRQNFLQGSKTDVLSDSFRYQDLPESEKKKIKKETRKRDLLLCLKIMAPTTVMAVLTFFITHNTTNIALLYVLAVVCVARYTTGYWPGFFASGIGMIFVNYVFTYPYMHLDFTLDGYVVTFAGMVILVLIISTLTTDLKEQNKKLNEREKMLMEAEKETMRANLLRAVSHDLRTPLTSIIGTGNLYIENGSLMTEKEKENLVVSICEDANWLLNMVENLLSVTRIRRGDTKVNTSLEPLEEVVAEAVQRFRKRIPEAEVVIQVPEEFVMVPMDATLIEQVIINLLENAFYHAETTRPVDLYVDIQTEYVWFHVRDYGKGIAAERLDMIFDGYGVGENISSDSRKGMGIGLTICKTIINAHEGKIYARNHAEGAEFLFSLPLTGGGA